MRMQMRQYPSLRRSITRRVARRALAAPRRLPRPRGGTPAPKASPFLRRTTQHLETTTLPREIGRAVLALGGLAAWGSVVLLIAG
jgi:hypothetical protein